MNDELTLDLIFKCVNDNLDQNTTFETTYNCPKVCNEKSIKIFCCILLATFRSDDKSLVILVTASIYIFYKLVFPNIPVYLFFISATRT